MMPEGPQVVAAAIRDLGFAGMGLALLHPIPGVRRRFGTAWIRHPDGQGEPA
jgi:hypothetical protein